MKKMYWRPRRVSRTVLLLISVASVAGYAGVESWKRKIQEPWHQEKLAASRLAESAFKVIRAERLRRGLPIDAEADPAGSGLVGSLMTPPRLAVQLEVRCPERGARAARRPPPDVHPSWVEPRGIGPDRRGRPWIVAHS